MSKIISAAAFVLFSLYAGNARAVVSYSVTDLGTLGGNGSQGYAVNASGQVAGYSLPTGSLYQHAVLWTGTTPIELGNPFGPEYSYTGSGFAINDSGQIAGSAINASLGTRAILWTSTSFSILGTINGTGGAEAFGINASGQVAGTSNTSAQGGDHAVRWTGTTPTDLGTLGGDYSFGIGINASGQVAGYSEITPGSRTRLAVRWTGIVATALATFGGTDSNGYAINESGQVAGSALTSDSIRHAALWTATTPLDLGTLGGTFSEAFGINNSGDVVGMAETDHGPIDAFFYTGGTMYDLNSLLAPDSGITNLTVGFSGGAGNPINDLDQIAAYGTIGGQTHALLLTPTGVPEPSTMLFGVMAGMAGILFRGTRNARNG